MLVLAFVATVTPFEVGFLTVGLNALFYVNRAVDAVLGPEYYHPDVRLSAVLVLGQLWVGF